MKNFLTMISLIICTFTAAAQSTDFPEEYQIVRYELDYMFENLDKTKVPTGLLLDYAIDLVEFSNFNGTELSENNQTDISIYSDILKSIRSAAVAEKPFGNVNEIMESFQTDNNFVYLSLTAFKYNFIREDALEDGLIEYNETREQVSDAYVDTLWQNPYSEDIIMAFTPNCRQKQGPIVIYSFPIQYMFRNITFSNIYFDPGDGLGYRNMTSQMIQVRYLTPGIKTLKLKVRTSDGRFLDAHSTIEITEPDASAYSRTASSMPNYTEIITTTYDKDSNLEGVGIEVKAQMSCYYKTGGSSITKPFIIVEGFDPWILNYLTDDIPECDMHLGSIDYTNLHQRFDDESTLEDDYDFIYIDWDNSLADIRANAKLLIKIIERINQMKASSGSSEKNVIMGQSMGGLVARYALRKMEIDAKDHETSIYISHDSPHLGANVPLGALYFIHQAMSLTYSYQTLIDIYDLFNNNLLGTAEKRLMSVVYGESVKQMLVNHVHGLCVLDNRTHDGWQQELSILGFPKKTENLAIVNGKQFDRESTLVKNGSFLYIEGHAQSSFLTSAVLTLLRTIFQTLFYSPPKVSVYIEVNPLSQACVGKDISKIEAFYTKKFLWIFPKKYPIFSSVIPAPSSGLFYDDFPGSQYDLDKHISDRDVKYEGSSAWGNYSLEFMLCDRFMFIPTASALAINYDGTPNKSHYSRDYFNIPPIAGTETPFDSYLLATYSQKHIHLTDTMFNWISQQIEATIEGPDTLMSNSATYEAIGFNGPVQWKSSNNTRAIIDNNGKLTPTGNGIVKISAESYNDGALIRKTKHVMVGFPDIAITYSFSPGVGHMFSAATPDSDDMEGINSLVQAGYLKYEWSILCDEEDMVTTVSRTPSITHLPKQDEVVTVCLRLVDNNGNKGETYSRTVNLKNPFTTNYQYVEIDQNGNVKFVKSNGYESTPSEDFTINFRNIIYSPDDNALALVQKYLKGNTSYLAYLTSFGTQYIQGAKVGLQLKWEFPLFENRIFVTALEDMIEDAVSGYLDPGEMTDFGLFICNHQKQFMQIIPFAIIYKPIS